MNSSKRTAWLAPSARFAMVLGAILSTPFVFQSKAYAQGGLPLIRDTEIERLLNDYARPIFEAAGLGGGRVAIRIIRSRIFNAFVVDGRNVFIHTGAIMQSDTPNQIIGVIAHEAGHIAGGDLAALRSRIQRDQTKLLLMRILGIGAAIATGNSRAVAAGDDLVTRSLLAERRAQEAAADQRGLLYLNRTKQSARGMLQTFERFQRQEYISDTHKDPFVRSHPVATDRLSLLRDRARQSPFFNKTDTPRLQLRHDMMRAKLSGYLESPAAVFNRYPRRDNSLPAKYARAIATFFRGGPNGLNAAIRAVNELIQLSPKYPYFYELRADFLQRSGRAADAVADLRRALKLDPNSSLMRIRLGTALLATGNPKVVNDVIKMMTRTIRKDARDGDPKPRAHRVLGQAYYRAGKVPQSYAATAEAYFLVGNLKQAQVFAKRAQPGLRKGSPAWRKMDEIVTFQSKS